MEIDKVLITGGNGFIGHHVCEHILKNTNWNIYIIDKLTYASFGYDRLKDVNCYDDNRIRHFCHDFTKSIEASLLEELRDVNYIIHLGAETHVDNSIINAEPFVLSNVLGTYHILEFARKCKYLKKMVYFSTDEVFGPADKNVYPKGFLEWDRYNSTNPYAATKAGGEELCLAFANTYDVPVFITHTMNVFGERQHPEKFIPKCIKALLNKETMNIHADPSKTIPGSRFWIHARNVAEALQYLLILEAEKREKFNIVGEKEVSNLEMLLLIAEIMGIKAKYKLVDFHSSRPGHDLRYGLNGEKLKSRGFSYPKSFEESLEKTVLWTLENPKWLGGLNRSHEFYDDAEAVGGMD